MSNVDKILDLEIELIMIEARYYNSINETVKKAHGNECKYSVNMTNSSNKSSADDINKRLALRDECMKKWAKQKIRGRY